MKLWCRAADVGRLALHMIELLIAKAPHALPFSDKNKRIATRRRLWPAQQGLPFWPLCSLMHALTGDRSFLRVGILQKMRSLELRHQFF